MQAVREELLGIGIDFDEWVIHPVNSAPRRSAVARSIPGIDDENPPARRTRRHEPAGSHSPRAGWFPHGRTL